MAQKKKKTKTGTKIRLLKPWGHDEAGDETVLADHLANQLIMRKIAEPVVTA